MADYPKLTVHSRTEWRSWLEANHDQAAGVWLVRFKKGKGPHVGYDDVVDDAVAFGWIDSQPRSLDEKRSQLLITPRKRGSRWSQANKERVARLRADRRMTAAGEAADSRNWDAFPRSTRRAILEWILAAKRPKTRTSRIADTVEKASLNIRANQWRQPTRGRDGDRPQRSR